MKIRKIFDNLLEARRTVLILLAFALLSAYTPVSSVRTHAPQVEFSAHTSAAPTIDSTVSLSEWPTTAHTLTLATSIKDASITNSSMDTNFGADGRLDFGFNNYSNTISRIVVQFDLPPTLSEAAIISATLKLWGPNPWSSGYPSGEALRACRITHDWVEGTGKWGATTQDGVTWNEYNYNDGLVTATNNWGTPGVDYTLTDSSTVTIPSYPLPSPFRNWTVTNIVKDWVSSTHPNFGFLIKLENESLTYKGGVFNSKEYGEEYGEQYAPKLEITYTVPTIESCEAVGAQKDYFGLGETIYVNGSGFSPSTAYSLYIVANQENWTNGMLIPERVLDSGSSVISDANGLIDPTDAWHNPQEVGNYDIVADVNGNGQYDTYVDALDDGDVEITAGFSVIPEFSSILLLFITATLPAIVICRRKNSEQFSLSNSARMGIVAKKMLEKPMKYKETKSEG